MVFSAFERMMAWRYLRSKRKEGFVSVITIFSLLGICLGVATLIIVMAVMNGFRHELLNRILGLNGHMGVYASYGALLGDYDVMAQKIKTANNVVAVIPITEGQVMVTSNKGGVQGGILRGMRVEDLAFHSVIVQSLGNMRLESFDDKDTIVLGYRLAQKLGVRVGDEVTLISPQGNSTAFGTIPRMKSFELIGTFDVGMQEYDSNFMFMNLADAQNYFATGDTVSNLEIFIDNPDDVESVRKVLAPIVGAGGSVVDWQNSNSSFFNAIQVERNVMFLILTLIIIVAAFNIISSLIMLVKDKGKDIGVLRTMGATKGMIMRIFFLSGSLIGIVGTMIGVVLGLTFCANIESIRQFLQSLTGTDLFSAEIYFLSKLPAKVDVGEVVNVVIMSLSLSLGATIYPSLRAAKMDPVEALRYE